MQNRYLKSRVFSGCAGKILRRTLKCALNFWKTFNVHNDGTISDVLVISLVVVESDRKKLANLIKSYEHKPIVKFPKGSKRKKVSLSSIMLLSNESKLSKPGDFNDIEKIKVKM